MLTVLTYQAIGNLRIIQQYLVMFERQERTAIFLLIGIAVTVLIATAVLGNMGKLPFARPYSEHTADGELVSFEGNIDQIALTRSGGHMTLIVENLSIFIPSEFATGLSLNKGDRIMVYGVVQTYHGKKEIVVNSVDDVQVRAVSPEN
jgi:uncharacterized SAM-binding protein YcdF (DUF218 family)